VSKVSTPSPADMLAPSKAAFQILLALADGEKHGYAVMQEVTQRTDGAVRLGPGTLYRTIKQMLAAGWIAGREDRPDPDLDNERRRYYCITESGRHVAAREAAQMETFVHAAYAKRILAVGGGRT